MQRYSYSEELPPGHIRLLEIERHEDNQLQGCIQIYDLSDPPRYEALSYVWGAEEPKFLIGRHEPFFDVPQNLYTALHTIMSLTDPAERRTLWIDQICINQKDDDEKSDQVKLIRNIYESAQDVLVWLGNPLPGIPNVASYLEWLPSLIYIIERNVIQAGSSVGLPHSDDLVWAIIRDILHKDWYHRVWTLQEAVLARELVVYYGANILDWDFVVKLYTVYSAAPLMLRRLHDQEELNYQPISWIQTYRKRWQREMDIDFTHLLWTCGFKKCSNPLDRIYGLLGISGESIRENIEPIYTAQEHQVFLDAFGLAIQLDFQLHILSLSFDRGDTIGLPTWCPNLKAFNGCVQLNSYFVGRRSLTEKSSKVSLADADTLRIQGLEIDKISRIAQSHYPSLEQTDPVLRAKLLSQFQKETLRLTLPVYESINTAQEVYCRTLVADVATEHGGHKWSIEEIITGCRSHFSRGSLRNKNEKTLSIKYESLAQKACIGRKFVVTMNGRVGLAPATCREGDVICVFLGACVPHVLRPNVEPADTTTFRFVGDCYLHGIMNMEALDMLEKGEVELREFIVT